MKTIFICTLIMAFVHKFTFNQHGKSHRRLKMLEFLIKNGELDTANHENLTEYDRFINEQIIYKTQSCTISIFGVYSAHAGKHISLESSSHIIFVNGVDLCSEMPDILSFLKKQNINKTDILIVLSKLAATYKYNNNLENRIQIKRPPPG
jgi:hypothetical protein